MRQFKGINRRLSSAKSSLVFAENGGATPEIAYSGIFETHSGTPDPEIFYQNKSIETEMLLAMIEIRSYIKI